MSRDWPLSPLTLIYCFCSFIVWSFNYYTSFYVVYLICSMLQSQNAITAYRMHFILNSVLLLNNFTDMSFDQRKPFPVKDCSPTLLFNHSHQLFHSFTIYFPLVGLSYEVSNNLVFSAVFPLVFDDGMRCYISISRKFMLAYNIYMAFYNLSWNPYLCKQL